MKILEKKWMGLIIWGFILVIGGYLRFIGILDRQQGFYVDEASIAYNSRSIGETLRDEYGQILPMVFRSFGDFKPALMEYMAIPWVLLLGEVAGVRLMAATLGILTVLLVGLATERIFERKEAGWLAAIVLATNSWHVNLSRHSIESVPAGFLVAMAIYLFGRKKLGWAVAVLALSTFAYHSARYLAPLLIGAMIWFDRPKMKVTVSGIVAFILSAIAIGVNMQPFANIRASGVSVFASYEGVGLVRHLLSAYLSYYSPRILSLGDWQPRNNVFEASNVWWWVLICFYVGLVAVLKWVLDKDGFKQRRGIVLFLLLVSPLPAIAAIDPFQAIRSQTMTIPLTMIAGLGGIIIFDWIKSRLQKRIVIVGLILMVAFESVLLTERLLIQNPIYAYDQWNTGYQEVVEKLMAMDTSDYRQIVVDNTDEPAIYSLWQVFGKVSTSDKIPLPEGIPYYERIRWTGPVSLRLKTGQTIKLKNIYWPKDQLETDILYIGSQKRFDVDAVSKAGAVVIDCVADQRGETKWMMVATPHELPESILARP